MFIACAAREPWGTLRIPPAKVDLGDTDGGGDTDAEEAVGDGGAEDEADVEEEET